MFPYEPTKDQRATGSGLAYNESSEPVKFVQLRMEEPWSMDAGLSVCPDFGRPASPK